MTFRVEFFADQAFFSMIKRLLINADSYNREQVIDFQPEETATAIIICHSACEAFLNLFARNMKQIEFHDYEMKSIIEKINTLYHLRDLKADWGRKPLQDLRRVDKIRNWLTHFKDSNIGLVNSSGSWVVDEINKKPKIDDNEELKYTRVKSYYANVRLALYDIAKLYKLDSEYEYLTTEDYTSFLVG